MHQSKAWWKEANVYQIWPHSFKDGNNDGIGDLVGALEKVDYLHDLGIDVVWFSPLYASPLRDMGYDIADYYSINPLYGTMQDWQDFVDALHDRGMKCMMDLVVNHSSSDCHFFQDSIHRRNGRDDWYIWQDGQLDDAGNRTEPNNWGALFGGSAWEWNETRGQYYLHTFDWSQPDFNWEHEPVRREVYNIMKYWMDKGCDGFRCDVINMISKTPGLPDAPITNKDSKYQFFGQLVFNGPKVHEYLHEMYEAVWSKYDAINVGECPSVTPEIGLQYVARAREEFQMIFQFEHVDIDSGPYGKFSPEDWKLSELKSIMSKWQVGMQEGDGWNSLYLENHDQPRCVSRYGNDQEFRDESTRMLALFHISLGGTVYVYQGQELGLTNRSSWPIDEQKDLESINHYNAVLAQRGTGADMSDVLEQIQKKGRDNARTPMHWSSESYAGFSTVEPWIAMMHDYEQYNAANQVGRPGSHYEWYKSCLRFRKENETLIYGIYEILDAENEKIYAFTRSDERRKLLVVCNFSNDKVNWHGPAGRVILSTHETSTDAYEPWEGRIMEIMK